MYADSLRMVGVRQDSTAVELLRQAIALDPEFALAHAELGRQLYLNAERRSREAAEAHFQTALRLADRLTVRERLWIQASAEDSGATANKRQTRSRPIWLSTRTTPARCSGWRGPRWRGCSGLAMRSRASNEWCS